ncbi:MAG: RNA-binding S4 domain-containing protein [Bacteroidetes bacterium]|nr:RNA-binding S4 domain-containing protein [Bacteroidota bacterium]
MIEGVRIDKWLWAVRLFKTRSQATDACKSGKIRIEGQIVKPSREVKPGEEVSISHRAITRTIKVIGLITNRVGAPLVPQFMQDLTPEDEYARIRMKRELNFEYRDPGAGRPTKRQRREIEVLKKYLKE